MTDFGSAFLFNSNFLNLANKMTQKYNIFEHLHGDVYMGTKKMSKFSIVYKSKLTGQVNVEKVI